MPSRSPSRRLLPRLPFFSGCPVAPPPTLPSLTMFSSSSLPASVCMRSGAGRLAPLRRRRSDRGTLLPRGAYGPFRYAPFVWGDVGSTCSPAAIQDQPRGGDSWRAACPRCSDVSRGQLEYWRGGWVSEAVHPSLLASSACGSRSPPSPSASLGALTPSVRTTVATNGIHAPRRPLPGLFFPFVGGGVRASRMPGVWGRGAGEGLFRGLDAAAAHDGTAMGPRLPSALDAPLFVPPAGTAVFSCVVLCRTSASGGQKYGRRPGPHLRCCRSPGAVAATSGVRGRRHRRREECRRFLSLAPRFTRVVLAAVAGVSRVAF
ncbi:hypothetical protein I4F81_003899 [Pyropia yezoensis]|uniref:Uncharacterized protein n=1 Tax=Pyropia yezoensis TaxID=2788 RepID=A0ACC3BTM4_PYRYE|nr:hypothetical protein I4F81_003899 [Neopyropia yezoensis]